MGENMVPGAGLDETTIGLEAPGDFQVHVRWITTRLAVGGMIGTSANMRRLRASGITHVLNLQAEFDDAPLAAEEGVDTLWLPLESSEEVPAPEAVRAAIGYAQQAWTEPESRLYVHCLAGLNRSPLLAYAILRSSGNAPADALAQVRAACSCALLDEETAAEMDALLGDAGGTRPGGTT